MAFRRNKDVKKSSYYVWFLGAKESKGLRGEEYVLPVLHQLIDVERRLEPSKVTLQISNKGIKIIQNVPKKSNKCLSSYHPDDRLHQHLLHPPRHPHIHQPHHVASSSSPHPPHMSPSSSDVSVGPHPIPACKMEQIKHLIPHNAISCVAQEDDVICCILMIYNPITKCPLHVHAYRCDSVETASALKAQMQTLIDRPENQKKFKDIERRLALTGLTSLSAQRSPPPVFPSCSSLTPSPQQRTNSDGRSSARTESDGTDDSFDSNDPRIVYRRRGNPQYQSQPELQREHSSRHLSSTSVNPPKKGSNNSHKFILQPDDPDDLEIETQKASMFESLAHELKVKMGNAKAVGPLLLPPRDYDTISRGRGNLVGIEERKSTNKFLVGAVGRGQRKSDSTPAADSRYQTRSESSGKSSGIGSDEALPVIREVNNRKGEKGVIKECPGSNGIRRLRETRSANDFVDEKSEDEGSSSSSSSGSDEDELNVRLKSWLSTSTEGRINLYGSSSRDKRINGNNHQMVPLPDHHLNHYRHSPAHLSNNQHPHQIQQQHKSHQRLLHPPSQKEKQESHHPHHIHPPVEHHPIPQPLRNLPHPHHPASHPEPKEPPKYYFPDASFIVSSSSSSDKIFDGDILQQRLRRHSSNRLNPFIAVKYSHPLA